MSTWWLEMPYLEHAVHKVLLNTAFLAPLMCAVTALRVDHINLSPEPCTLKR